MNWRIGLFRPLLELAGLFRFLGCPQPGHERGLARRGRPQSRGGTRMVRLLRSSMGLTKPAASMESSRRAERP